MISEESKYKILLAPHVSEKTTRAEASRQYVFKVAPFATKPIIKSAVEKIFNVKVLAVQVSNVKSKEKRFSKTIGKRKGWKKAYITLKEGQTIDLSGGLS